MTADEFNEKYKAYIPEGYWGLEFDIPEVTAYIDSIMEGGLANIPGFKLHQVKLKFGMCRFYYECQLPVSLQAVIEYKIEDEVNNIIKKKEDGRVQ